MYYVLHTGGMSQGKGMNRPNFTIPAHSNYQPQHILSYHSYAEPRVFQPNNDLNLANSYHPQLQTEPTWPLHQASLYATKCYPEMLEYVSWIQRILSEFAAQMTCFFQFCSISRLKGAEIIAWLNGALVSPLPPLAVPEKHFEDWIYQMLIATKVAPNVVHLALFLIYKRRMLFSSLQDQLWRTEDRDRIFLAALVISQKVLDDKPFTNKDWGFVSQYNLNAVNLIEREFLGDIQYNLLVSREEWEEWLRKLNCFHLYYQLALNVTPSHISYLAAPAHHHLPYSKEKMACGPFAISPSTLKPLDMDTTVATSAFYSNGIGNQLHTGTIPTVCRKRVLETGQTEHFKAKRQKIGEMTTSSHSD